MHYFQALVHITQWKIHSTIYAETMGPEDMNLGESPGSIADCPLQIHFHKHLMPALSRVFGSAGLWILHIHERAGLRKVAHEKCVGQRYQSSSRMACGLRSVRHHDINLSQWPKKGGCNIRHDKYRQGSCANALIDEWPSTVMMINWWLTMMKIIWFCWCTTCLLLAFASVWHKATV